MKPVDFDTIRKRMQAQMYGTRSQPIRRCAAAVVNASAHAGVATRAGDGDDATEGMVLTGHAAVFDTYSRINVGFGMWFDERTKRGAFRKVLSSDELDVRYLLNHDGVPYARTTNGTLVLREDATGLLTVARLNPALEADRDLYARVERQDISQMSYAFTLDEDGEEWADEPDFDDDDFDWRNWDGFLGRRTITRYAGLYDTSPVTYPAFPTTSVATGERAATTGDSASCDESQRAIRGEDQQPVSGGDFEGSTSARDDAHSDSSKDADTWNLSGKHAKLRATSLTLSRRRPHPAA